MRAEGLTELIGDIVVNCTGGTPTAVGAPIPQITLTVFLTNPVTSRILTNGGSEALLLLDEPGSAANPTQRLCGSLNGCVVQGTGGAGEPFNGDATRPNIFQGTVSGNSLVFYGVPVDPPGPTGHRVFRITNVRVNATVPTPPAGAPVSIFAFLSGGGAVFLPVDNPQQVVGFALAGHTFSAGSITAPECTRIRNTDDLAVVGYDEGFSVAFKPRTIAGPTATAVQRTPGTIYHSESGFVLPDLPGAGLADSGTRLRATFRNIPAGVSLWVSTANIGATANSMAQLISSETGPFLPIASTITLQGTDAAAIPVFNGNATVVWEVTASDPSSIESFDFIVFLDAASNLSANTPPPTTIGTLAPAPPVFAADAGASARPSTYPVPRFADTSSSSNLITFERCTTNLLFPFVTSRSPFDTGLAIANTTSDPIGTTAESGTCTLSFYGEGAPVPFITPTIASGATYTTFGATAFTNFQGYVIAACNFRYAHGFATVSGSGSQAVAYLALVLPVTRVKTAEEEDGQPIIIPVESLDQ